MIVGGRDIHHRPDDNGSITSDGPVFDGVKSQHAALGRIHNRVESIEPLGNWVSI